MSSKKALKAKADRLFSEWVRSQGKCEWCGSGGYLQCAHIFTRHYLSTRYSPINAVCLCSGCHRRAHAQPVEFVEFIKDYLGEDIYEELRYEAKVRIEKATPDFFDTVIKKITAGEPPYVK